MNARPARRALARLSLAGALALGASAALAGCSAASSSSSGSAAGSSTLSPTGVAQTDSTVVGDIPDTTVYIKVTAESGAFSFTVPQGWSKSTSTPVTFSDKLNSIASAQSATASAPTVASVKSDLVPKLQAAGHNFALTDVTQVSRTAGSAILVRYLVDSTPDSVTGKVVRDAAELYVFWKAGTEAQLTLTGPQAADNVDPWKTVTNSFAWAP